MNALQNVRGLLLTGVAGPLVFAAAVLVSAAQRRGYSHIDQFISELGETGAEFAWFMNYAGFMLSAVLMLAFVIAIHGRFPRTVLSTAATVLLAVFAVSVFLAGLFSCDVGCPTADRSPEQKIHDLVSILAFPAFILGVLLRGISLLRDLHWRRFGYYSLATALLSAGLLVAMVQSEATRDGTGAWQRLFLGVLFVWMMLLAVRLWRDTVTGKS